jgi:LPXTG-motif cell wall-anchored protein
MNSRNLIVISVFAAVLLSAAFVSLAAADDAASDATTTPPDPLGVPDPSTADLGDNSTVTPGDEILYTIQGDNTAANDTQAPGAENPNPIVPQTGTTDNTLTIMAAVIAIAVVLGAVGIVFYPKKATKA